MQTFGPLEGLPLSSWRYQESKWKVISKLDETLRPEDVWGSEGIAPPFLTSALDGENDQLYAPAALFPGKQCPVPFLQEARWSLDPVQIL
jgi:hypothetical protein